MKRPSRRTFLATAAGLTLSAAPLVSTRARAADDLVVQGETIASGELLAAARAEGVLNLYSVNMPEAAAVVTGAFKQDTGIGVNYLRLPSWNMFPRVTAEFAAGKLAADYVDLTDLLQVGEMVKRGVLAAPYKVRSFDALAPALKDQEGRWYALHRSVWVIGYNNEAIKPADAPTSWAAFMDPKWAGKIGLNSAEGGGSAYALFAFLRDVVTPDAFTRLGAQKPRIFASVAPLTANVVRGEVPLGAINGDALVAQRAAGAPIGMNFGSDGTPGFPISGGMVAGAKHPNAAKLWLEWVSSKRGSSVVATTGSYGIHPAAPPPSAPGVTYPPVDKVWSATIDHWNDTEARYIADWKKALGVS